MTTKSEIADRELIMENGEVVGWRFKFTNGNTFEALATDLNEIMQFRYAVHGIGQKLGDSYAGAKNKGLSVDDCEAGVRELWEASKRGQFTMTRSAGGVLLEAFLRVIKAAGKKESEGRELFATFDDATKAELRKEPHIKAALAEIAAERAIAAKDALTEEGEFDLRAWQKSH